MSSITLDEVAETARNRLRLPPNEAPRLVTLVPGALKALGKKVARRADFEALRNTKPIDVVLGVITLTIADLLVDVLPDTGLLVINNRVAKAAPSYNDLVLKMPNDVYRWALKGSTEIHVKDLNTGFLGTVNEAGTLTYNRIPALGDLPEAYDKQLIDEVVLMAMGKVETEFNQGEEGLSVNLNAN